MEWRPIETAPKNPEGKFWGPTVLVYCTADGLPWPAYYGQANKTDDSTKGAWFVADGVGDNEISAKDVSHWMPLPPPPA